MCGRSDGGVRGEGGLHQGSALSPCLFAMVMDRMRDEIREEGRLSIVGTFPTMLVLICSRAY